jgi:nucleotide-binding universal stress UspA family protein
MGSIFVAYGERERRTAVLEFAVDQAATCGHELVVYHIQEAASESVAAVREEIESVVQEVEPFLVYDIEIRRWDERSRPRDGSKQTQLLEAIFESDREFDYVIMGEVERGPIEELIHSSMTEAVLKKHEIPVLLVPI